MGINHTFDIVGAFDESDSSEFSPQRLVNMYVDTNPGGMKQKTLFSTPGLNLDEGIKFNQKGIGRKIYVFMDHAYAVIGKFVYRIDKNLNHSKIGEIGSSVGYVGIADNGKQIMIVDGTGGWLWDDSASSFAVIGAPGFPSRPSDVTVLANRFLVNNLDINTDRINFSAENDGTSWDALDYFSITSQPDKVVGLRRLNDRLFIIGERITEVWFDAGTPILPYRRSDVLPYGCVSPGCIASAFGFLMWISKTDNGVGSAVITTGTNPVPISTQNIEKEFEKYSNTDDAISFIYRDGRGHEFYQTSFTKDNKTWVFDIGEKRWFELNHNATDRHLAQSHVFFNNKHYVVDYKSPYLYEMSKLYVTDNGVPIRRLRVTPPLYDASYRKIIVNSILFDLKQGLSKDGLEIGSNPTLKLRISKDGGITYGNELSSYTGKLGERTVNTQFFRLGQAGEFIFEIKYDDPTVFMLLGASVNIDIEKGGL